MSYCKGKATTTALNILNKAQRGSALVLAVFIMVVVLMFGTTMMNIFNTSSENITQEVLGTRALAAANAGMQGQLQRLFPLNNAASLFDCGVDPDEDFNSFDDVSGLYTCTATVSCENYATVNDVDYYRLVSTGTCGSGTMESSSDSIVLSSRTVVVEAKELN